jgi:hypothetical protein
LSTPIVTEKKIDLSDIYVLWFRTGANPRTQDRNFHIPRTDKIKDFRDVISRLKAYCDNCGFRFVKVEKFLSNLEEDEAKVRRGLSVQAFENDAVA